MQDEVSCHPKHFTLFCRLRFKLFLLSFKAMIVILYARGFGFSHIHVTIIHLCESFVLPSEPNVCAKNIDFFLKVDCQINNCNIQKGGRAQPLREHACEIKNISNPFLMVYCAENCHCCSISCIFSISIEFPLSS